MSQTFSFPDPSPRDNGDGAGVVLSSLPESDVRSALRSTGSFPDPSPRGYHSEEGAEPQATSPDQEEVTRGKKERKSREKKEAKEAQENPKSGKTKEKPSGASRKQRSNPIKYVLIVVIILAVIFGGATLVNKFLAPSIPEQYQLSVSGLPPGARIYLDGQDTGMKTPALLQGLKPDVEYLIKLTAAGYESKEQTFVARGEELVKKPNPDARIFLNPAKGQIRINSVPPNATVRMGGEIIGKTPLIRKGVTRAPGDIRIDFLLKGCKPETRSFAWGDRVEEELSIKLKCDK